MKWVIYMNCGYETFHQINLLSDEKMYADETNLTYVSKDPDELFSSLTPD